QVPAVLGKHMADLAHRAIAIVSSRSHQHRRTARPVALEHDLIDLPALELARAAHNRPLDVVSRHGDVLSVIDRRTQPRIPVRVPPATRCNRDFLDDFRKLLAALSVGSSFLVLNRYPFGMTGHYRPLTF